MYYYSYIFFFVFIPKMTNIHLLHYLQSNYPSNNNVLSEKKNLTDTSQHITRHFLPANKEWYSNIYSYNKHNLILAPKISEWTYKISKSYLNASPNKNKMDNIMVVKERTEKKNEFSKVYFSLKNYAKKVSNTTNEQDHNEFLNSIRERKVRNVPYATLYLNKYLSLFRKKFKVDSNVKHKNNRSMKFFYAKKAITTSFGLQNSISLRQNSKKRYSVIKTFLSKPEIGYSNNRTKVVISIYNKKSFFLLKNIKNSFDLVKTKLKKSKLNMGTLSIKQDIYNSTKNKNKTVSRKFKPNFKLKDTHLQIQKLKTKFIHKLHNKPITSFFIYMWNHINVKGLRLLNNNTYLFNHIINKLKKLMYGFESFKNLFFFKHSLMLYFYENYKVNSNNTLPMKNILFKLFLKKTFHNIISLKYWNLDSKILADIITTKLIDRTKKVLKVLKKSITHIPYFNIIPTILKIKEENQYTTISNLNVISSTLFNNHVLFMSKYKNNLLLDNLQHKWKIGTKIEAKGRITKRKTAQRSLKKIKYIGSLANLLSSQTGKSTYLSRGINKSNLQYINNNNYSANGSFGLKVSISSLQTLQKWNIS